MIDEIRFEIANLRRLYFNAGTGEEVTAHDLALIIEGLEKAIDQSPTTRAEVLNEHAKAAVAAQSARLLQHADDARARGGRGEDITNLSKDDLIERLRKAPK